MKHYNIMTSCDENLLSQVNILLYSVGKTLTKDAQVNFYLFHRGIELEKLEELDFISEQFENLTVYSVVVPNVKDYDYIASHGGGWAGEAYFSLCAHELLPDVDRILYLDAGDVIVVNDIQEFYNADFEENLLLVSNARRTDEEGNPKVYVFDDLADEKSIAEMLDSTFNSGSYLLNLEGLRQEGRSMRDYLEVVEIGKSLLGADNHKIYFGDQGFLSFAFVGQIKYWGYPEMKELISTKYNFFMGWYHTYAHEPRFKPSIIHFVGGPKPWTLDFIQPLHWFPGEPTRSFKDLISGQEQWYRLWYQYASEVERILGYKI